MITEQEYMVLLQALKQATDAMEEICTVIDNQGEELARQAEEIEKLLIKVNQ